MQRREFIKDALAGFPMMLLTPAALVACSRSNTDIIANGNKKVIVVGAGISGLAAAKSLKESGFQVTVLEAQEKVGGRLRTNRSLGIPFDEGASWIHGIKGNPIVTLAQEAGTESILADDTSILSFDLGGKLRSDATFLAAEDKFYSILETMMKKGNPNQSFETVFNANYPAYANDRLWKFFLSAYVTFDTGDLNQLSSLLYYEGEEYSGGERIISNGYDTIPLYLAKGLEIVFNQRVSKIDYTATKVNVTHNETISEADYVVVTVPLGVLKANVIQFLPTLPTIKHTAIQKMGMNSVNKFLLTWEKRFWDDKFYIAYSPEEKDKFNYFVNVTKLHPEANALMTFAYADYARQTETMSDEEIIQEIMLHLKDMYGNAIPNPTHFLRTKWQTNENTFGSYSYTAVGTEMRHFDDLAAEIENKLFFAGEHTEIDYFSTAHGAYLSGIREADKIIGLQ